MPFLYACHHAIGVDAFVASRSILCHWGESECRVSLDAPRMPRTHCGLDLCRKPSAARHLLLKPSEPNRWVSCTLPGRGNIEALDLLQRYGVK